MNKTEQEVLNSLYEWYKDTRAKIEHSLIQNNNKLNSSIITISSGAITLTITFFAQLVQNSTEYSILLIKISWIFLTSTILIITGAYIDGRKGLSKGIEVLDIWQKKNIKELEKGILNYPILTNKYSKSSEILYMISYVCFAIGVLLMLIFALISF